MMTFMQNTHFTKILSRALYVQSCPCKRVGITEGTRARLEKNSVAIGDFRGYLSSVAAKSVTGRENPSKQKAHSAQDSISGVFFCLRFRFMAAVRGQTSVWPGSFCPGIPTPRIAATQSCRKDRGSSSAKGASPMLTRLFSLTPSEVQNKVERHRARAIAQLKSESSLKVRHQRYNAEMARARFFEAMLAGGAQ